MDILLLILDEAISTLFSRPSSHRINKWRHWIATDGWTPQEIEKFAPTEIKPYL